MGGRARQGEGSFSGRAGPGREKEVSVGEQGRAGRRKFQWESRARQGEGSFSGRQGQAGRMRH